MALDSRRLGAAVLAAALSMAACSGPARPATPQASIGSGAPAGKPADVAAAQKAPGPYVANGDVDGSSGKVSLQMLDTMKYQSNTVKNVKPGQQVAIELKNAGATVHDVFSPALGMSKAFSVNPGGTSSTIFTAPAAPGTYDFWCTQPGHAQAGMIGQVVVQ